MSPIKEKSRATHSVSTATAAPDSGKQVPFFSANPLPGESQAEATSRIDFLDNAAEAVSMYSNCSSPFFKHKKLTGESGSHLVQRRAFLSAAFKACLNAGQGNLHQQIELYAGKKNAVNQLNELQEQAAKIQLDLLPFFRSAPLPGESKEKTNQRLQFIHEAARAMIGTVDKIGISVQQQLLLFIKQNNLFEEARTFWGRQDLEKVLWEMFEALVRDEISAPDWEIRSIACSVYRWLQQITNAIYPMQEAA